MSLPKSRMELRSRWESGERFSFFLFYGHQPPETGVDASCLSQWFARTFVIDSIEYPTAEHWMMAEKARLFGDREMLGEILSCDDPREAKSYGRKVRGFDKLIWDQGKLEIVRMGNLAKFTQHQDLQDYLIATAYFSPGLAIDDIFVRESIQGYSVGGRKGKIKSSVILVEAAGRDVMWGIGLGKNNPKSLDPFAWRGHNLLGFVLTSVRESILRNDFTNQNTGVAPD